MAVHRLQMSPLVQARVTPGERRFSCGGVGGDDNPVADVIRSRAQAVATFGYQRGDHRSPRSQPSGFGYHLRESAHDGSHIAGRVLIARSVNNMLTPAAAAGRPVLHRAKLTILVSTLSPVGCGSSKRERLSACPGPRKDKPKHAAGCRLWRR
jgi:hypothetical protein